MLLTRTKVQPRNNHNRQSQLKNGFKSKHSLPQTCSSAKGAFEEMKLTQSHQIQDLHSNEFQLNILPPPSSKVQTEPISKKFSSPQWLITSNMTSSFAAQKLEKTSQNPETHNQTKINSQNEYENSEILSQKTESQTSNDLLKVQKSQIPRLLEMTVSDDKSRQLNETQIRNQQTFDNFDSKSAFLCDPHSPDSDKANHTTFDLRENEKSTVSHKPRSAIIGSRNNVQNIDKFYKHELEMYSEYGLKPYEQNRLKKIQQLQKLQLLKQQQQGINERQMEQCQQYFNLSKANKTSHDMKKIRKCSAIVQTHNNDKVNQEYSKKSLSKQKHSFSKGKKLVSPKLASKKV